MKAAEFMVSVDNGVITMPFEYKDKFKGNVKVILLQEENAFVEENIIVNEDNFIETNILTENANDFDPFGTLADILEPSLWEGEGDSWDKEIVAKYKTIVASL